LKAIGQGGFGVAYLAKHARFGTVVYKKLNADVLGDRSVSFKVVLLLMMLCLGSVVL